jgi:hypothetical protein
MPLDVLCEHDLWFWFSSREKFWINYNNVSLYNSYVIRHPYWMEYPHLNNNIQDYYIHNVSFKINCLINRNYIPNLPFFLRDAA